MGFDTGSFLASLFISSIGFVLFVYGRRMSRIPHGLAGLVLMVFPYFVPSVLFALAIAAAVVGALWFAVKLGW